MKSFSVAIQMKATEQSFLVVLFIVLYEVVLTFESVDEILKCDHTRESYWAVLYCETVNLKVVLTLESVDEILKDDHSNERHWAVLSCGAVYYALHGSSNYLVCEWNPNVWPFMQVWTLF